PIIAEVELPAKEAPAPPPRKNRIDPEATRAYSTVDVMMRRPEPDPDDAETMIPLGPEGQDIDPNEWLTSRKTELNDAMAENGNDQTLLDGIDQRSVAAAIEKQRAENQKKQRPTVLRTPDQDASVRKNSNETLQDGSVDPDNPENADYDMDQIIA